MRISDWSSDVCSSDLVAFVRGATEAINLVAYSHPRKGRVLLSTLEHHSNIVPWQLAGWQVDVCPLTADGRIDLGAAEALLTPAHNMVAISHVSNVLCSPPDVPRAAELAPSAGAQLLIACCPALPRLPADAAALAWGVSVVWGPSLDGPPA